MKTNESNVSNMSSTPTCASNSKLLSDKRTHKGLLGLQNIVRIFNYACYQCFYMVSFEDKFKIYSLNPIPWGGGALLKISLGNPYLKTHDLSKLFVTDASMKKLNI